MKEEEIKQNAEEYVSNLVLSEQEEENYKFTFIDGAHSRDGEIEQLKKALSSAQKAMAELAEIARNPWISVDEGLPECKWDERVSKNHSDYCLVLQADGSMYVAQYFCDFEAWSETSYMCEWLRNITHWMPIPELKKRE